MTISLLWLLLAGVWFIMQGSRTIFSIDNKLYDNVHAAIAVLIGLLMIASILWIRNPTL